MEICCRTTTCHKMTCTRRVHACQREIWRASGGRVTADPVRVLVVTDWDVGFPLTTRPPLADVGPGESYVTEFIPQRSIAFYEVLVEGFALVQISVGTRTSTSKVEEHGPRRLYRLDEALTVGPDESVRIHLCNNTDTLRKQKDVTLVRDVTTDWPTRHQTVPETGRAEDSVPCTACDKKPGDSCDGPTSHPSRHRLYLERAR